MKIRHKIKKLKVQKSIFFLRNICKANLTYRMRACSVLTFNSDHFNTMFLVDLYYLNKKKRLQKHIKLLLASALDMWGHRGTPGTC